MSTPQPSLSVDFTKTNSGLPAVIGFNRESEAMRFNGKKWLPVEANRIRAFADCSYQNGNAACLLEGSTTQFPSLNSYFEGDPPTGWTFPTEVSFLGRGADDFGDYCAIKIDSGSSTLRSKSMRIGDLGAYSISTTRNVGAYFFVRVVAGQEIFNVLRGGIYWNGGYVSAGTISLSRETPIWLRTALLPAESSIAPALIFFLDAVGEAEIRVYAATVADTNTNQDTGGSPLFTSDIAKTRAPDNLMVAPENFGAVWGSEGASFVAEFLVPESYYTNNIPSCILSYCDASDNNAISFYARNPSSIWGGVQGGLGLYSRHAGGDNNRILGLVSDPSTLVPYKAAARLKGGDFALSINDGPLTKSAAAMPAGINQLRIGSGVSAPQGALLRNLQLWNIPLSDNDLMRQSYYPELGFSDSKMIAVQNYRFPAGPLMSAALRNPNRRK